MKLINISILLLFAVIAMGCNETASVLDKECIEPVKEKEVNVVFSPELNKCYFYGDRQIPAKVVAIGKHTIGLQKYNGESKAKSKKTGSKFRVLGDTLQYTFKEMREMKPELIDCPEDLFGFKLKGK